MPYIVTVLPQQIHIAAAPGENLLQLLRRAGLSPDAPCGGTGHCGKCRVQVDGKEALACQTQVDRSMTVILPDPGSQVILTTGISHPGSTCRSQGYLLAFDIGTTTVVGHLLEGSTCKTLATASALNPQTAYGADVISRIRYARSGHLEDLTRCIRRCIEDLTLSLCSHAEIDPQQITTVCFVGNPTMQQLFMGIDPENLARIPFAPVLTRAETHPAKNYIPILPNAAIQIVPNISGYIGADTVACILASGQHLQEECSLLVDIGTNGEMVLGNKHRLIACSTAAGPALEGANIQCGMRGQTGAIDHVWLENGRFCCSTIGNTEAIGICGSGLIDAIAAALDAGLLDSRGRILTEDRQIRLTRQVFLTQEDIRQVQMAKGAIAAGIELMAAYLGISLSQIRRADLAGAFGTYMNAASACRIGLLPPILSGKTNAIGNAAGAGARLLACSPSLHTATDSLIAQVEFLELATLPDFRRCFAKNMRF